MQNTFTAAVAGLLAFSAAVAGSEVQVPASSVRTTFETVTMKPTQIETPIMDYGHHGPTRLPNPHWVDLLIDNTEDPSAPQVTTPPTLSDSIFARRDSENVEWYTAPEAVWSRYLATYRWSDPDPWRLTLPWEKKSKSFLMKAGKTVEGNAPEETGFPIETGNHYVLGSLEMMATPTMEADTPEKTGVSNNEFEQLIEGRSVELATPTLEADVLEETGVSNANFFHRVGGDSKLLDTPTAGEDAPKKTSGLDD